MRKKNSILVLMAVGLIAVSSAAQGTFDFDGILAGMEPVASPATAPSKQSTAKGSIDFDSMLSAMGDGLYASVADAMSIDNTLDFITNAYSGSGNQSINGYYSDHNGSGGGYGSRNFSYSVPGTAVLPIHGFVTSGYGYRPRFGRMHRGIDISLNVGDTVRAALDGTVLRVSNDARGYGLFVCIRHDNGMETRYAHLSRILVNAGERLYAGDPVGLGGSTGNSTGPHLHFETRFDGEAVDPATMFDFSMPSGRTPYRSLADLDRGNPAYTRISSTTQESNVSAVTPASRSTYVVRHGDTIGSIARKHGMSVLTLCRLNMLSNSEILQPGRMLKLR